MAAETGDGNCLGWAARDPSGFLSPFKFNRRAVGSDDVSIKITHCGVCNGDLLWSTNEFGDSIYPVVPGHEIAGIVQEVGANVDRFKIGDHVGVGFFVNSCRDCELCNNDLEFHCSKGAIITFNSVDVDGTITKGGFSTFMVVHHEYCFKIPDKYPLEFAAPLLCAGLTVYAPMKLHKMDQPGKRLGVIGLGGLGHMTVKFGKAFGLEVTVLSTTMSKKDEALTLLGADRFVLSSDEQQMNAIAKSLDFIIDTASTDHSLDPYLKLLKTTGVIVIVAAPGEMKFSPINIVLGMNTIAGSAVAGRKMTQEMLDYCAAHDIYPIIETIPMHYVNEAFKRLRARDVKYRFVIDIQTSLAEFGNDVDRAYAVEPAKTAFGIKAGIRRIVEAEGIPYTYVSSNFFAGYFLPGLSQPGSTTPPRDKVVILGDGNPKVGASSGGRNGGEKGNEDDGETQDEEEWSEFINVDAAPPTRQEN
ncbi:hypothetical protein Nepgr_010685 [Nepenthes gracilis]|uniref:Enoyl reductase (ER) domain-containing protein n=1 Tax=Nepenthes gracilis TaxID=150966 RepID=A0AAD3SDQ2_NEPGR|nr:hypothetical protein Nepgr_010685 [Nepenthes gracilis]